MEYIKSLQSIGEEAERMDRLVTNLLWLAHRDNTELTLNYETLDLTDMLRVVIELLQPQAEVAGVCFQQDLPETISLEADADRLIQLFLNLLENALIYAPDSEVNIRGYIQNDVVEIAIADNGPGIAPEHLPHLFERFYRIDKARSRASGGTGLGLAIAAEIAQAHGGQITVDSQLDRGTIFIVTLPTSQPEKSR
jgi:signal transduction histidine kinase